MEPTKGVAVGATERGLLTADVRQFLLEPGSEIVVPRVLLERVLVLFNSFLVLLNTRLFEDVVRAYIGAMTQPGSWCRQCGRKQMPGQDQIPHTKMCFVRRFRETINDGDVI